MRITIIIIVTFLVTVFPLNAQLTFPQTDSISYAMFKNENWKKLTHFGATATANGFDFYYLNLRTGIAHYHLGNFEAAETWLKKSLDNNASGAIAKEYLFWIYQQTERKADAGKLYKSLPPDIQNRLKYKTRSWVDFGYIEGGLKSSSLEDSIGISVYAHLGLKHKISTQFDIYHAYTFIQQDLFWGDFRQHQYYFAPTVHLPKGWTVGMGGNYFDFQQNYDYFIDSTNTSSTEFIQEDTLLFVNVTDVTVQYNLRGKYNLTALFPHFYLSKSWNNFNVSLQYAWYGERTKEDYSTFSDTMETTRIYQNFEEISSETISMTNETLHDGEKWNSHHQFSLVSEYTWRFSNKKSLMLGLENHIVWLGNNDLKQVLVPYFSINFSEKVSLNGYWMQKGNYPISIAKGSLVFNNYDKYKHRISTTFRYKVSEKATFFNTFQWDKKIDDFSRISYNNYGVLTGLQVKF